MNPATVVLRSWADIHQLLRHGWLYRGQRDAAWTLQTSLERCCDRESIPTTERATIESELIREFRRSYHRYAAQVPGPRATLEWVSVMQHHGAPTRFLDFSYSIYVAAYFALETADSDCAIWALNGPWAWQQSATVFAAAGKSAADITRMVRLLTEDDEEVGHRLFFEPTPAKLAAPVNPFRLNERLRVQKGVFVSPGSVDAPFMENLQALPGHADSDNLVKIIIPAALRREALEQLNGMNVNTTSLFPGLDGFARALGVYHMSFNPIPWESGDRSAPHAI